MPPTDSPCGMEMTRDCIANRIRTIRGKLGMTLDTLAKLDFRIEPQPPQGCDAKPKNSEPSLMEELDECREIAFAVFELANRVAAKIDG